MKRRRRNEDAMVQSLVARRNGAKGTMTAAPAFPLLLVVWTTIVAIFFAPVSQAALDIDNGVLGTPQVECSRDSVHFRVATQKPFTGKVYVKGEFDNPKCMRSMVPTEAPNKMQGENEVDFDDFPNAGGSKKAGSSRGNREEAGGGKEDYYEETASKGGATAPVRNRGGGVPEREEEEDTLLEGGTRARTGEGDGEEEEEVDDETIRQILQELQKRRNGNLDGSHRPIPSHLPGFGSAEQIKRWRSFLRGKPGLDGQGFRRYGSRLSPDANGECPLICPPCEDCDRESRQQDMRVQKVGSRQRRVAEHSAELKVLLEECNTRRDRVANPPGMQISFTVVVSFHPSFITRVDRAYNIQCAYQEPERLLSTQIDVSPPPIIQISNQMEAPQCEYRIHGQQGSGEVRNVRVGETVEHQWMCHGGSRQAQQRDDANGGGEEEEEARLARLFGLLVHDCFVEDGKSRRQLVVDGRGCSTDPAILATPVYSSKALKASIMADVAKFPDGDLVGFQCSITVCMRDMGKCDGVTPPNCSVGQSNDVAERHNRTKRSAADEDALLDWELHSPLLTVFDLAEATEEEQTPKTEVAPLPSKYPLSAVHLRHVRSGHTQLCVSLPMFTTICAKQALVSVGTFMATVSTGTLVAVLLFRDPFSRKG